MMKKIAFLGGGNMASAIVSGMVKTFDPKSITVVDHNDSKLTKLAYFGVNTEKDLGDWVQDIDFWIWAVKPQNMKEAILPLVGRVKPTAVSLTIAAGIEVSSYKSWINLPIMRAMPNTPAMVGEGTTGLWVGDIDNESAQLAQKIFESVGTVILVNNESELDLVGAIPGSGPAYVFRFMESLMKAGIARGLSETQAKALSLGTVLGAAKLASQSQEEFSVLRQNVTSKGGTTAKALEVFNEKDIDAIVLEAIDAALKRTNELKELFR